MTAEKRILIVDDNESLLKSLFLILTRKGYAVVTAGNGKEAIKKVKESGFNMIFLDIKMPEMNGVDAFLEIKSLKSEAVVVMMTAYSSDILVKKALEEGAREVLFKPLQMNNVLNLIKSQIGG
jgi:two-component system chemotaxis response regulator CheY